MHAKSEKKKKKKNTHTHTHIPFENFSRKNGADMRYKPPIICMYGRKRKKKTAQLVALWMKPISYWA